LKDKDANNGGVVCVTVIGVSWPFFVSSPVVETGKDTKNGRYP